VQLSHAADPVAACSVDRDDGLSCKLKLIADVDQAGVDRSGRALTAAKVVRLSCKAKFDQRYQTVHKVRQAAVLYHRFEIRHAVLD
jgi:hypothetical protein